MSKIVFFGDSITDAGRSKTVDFKEYSYGYGYVYDIVAELNTKTADTIIYNRGISGDRIVDLYARIKSDVWNLEPDVLSILVGVNDVWHEIESQNGVDIERFEKIYRMLLDDTIKRFPNIKIILMAPFVLHGVSTVEKFEQFEQVYEYAKVVKKIAGDYKITFIPLQDKLNSLENKFGNPHFLSDDGVHPTVAGAKVIADEWLKAYKEMVK